MPAFVAVSEESKSGVSPSDGGDATHAGESAPQPDAELEAAMAEAVASVDGAATPAQDGGGNDAAAAVTEAMIMAKKELEGALEQTQKEAASLRERWMRAAADLENYRRRASRERDDVKKFGIEKLLKDFLPVLDDMDRAVQAVEGGLQAEPADSTKQLLGGVQLVQKKFIATLEKHGVTTFEAVGTPFDPERHEAVQQAHAPVPAGAVASELQRGFLIHDRLLRPALVVVSLGPEGGSGASSE